jgi:hypothetical protein
MCGQNHQHICYVHDFFFFALKKKWVGVGIVVGIVVERTFILAAARLQ